MIPPSIFAGAARLVHTGLIALSLVACAPAAVVEQEAWKTHLHFEAEAADEILNPDLANDVQDNVQTGKPEAPPQVWIPAAAPGASGGFALEAPPQPHRTQNDPMLQETVAVYRLRFAMAGTYKVYIRAANNGTPENGSSDSFWLATAFGSDPPSKSRSAGVTGSFDWITNISPNYTVAPGDVGKMMELRVGARESGARLDAFVLSTATKLTAAELDAIFSGVPAATPTPAPKPTGVAPPGVVSTVAELDAALAAAEPGATITMRSGFWQDAEIVFDGTRSPNGIGGTSDALPITLQSEEPGKTILVGTSTLRIAGSYMVVSGLKFEGARLSGESPVVEFRNGSRRIANNCRLTQTAIIDYNPASPDTAYSWVSVYGLNNRIDHCWFSGMNHKGVQLVIWPVGEGPPNKTRIDGNYFGDRALGKGNGYETIRIGDSKVSNSLSEALVEGNLFERCDGEVEIISNKSVGNIYRGNTFRENTGQLTLRHGSKCLVEQNFFFGADKAESSGVRIIGPDHVVINNYFEGLTGTDFYAALSIVNGVPNSPLHRYLRAERNVIAFNTFVDCAEAITVGLVSSVGDNIEPPINNTIANNLIQLSEGQRVFKHITEPISTKYEGNVWSGGSLGIPEVAGVTSGTPQLVRAADGLMRPAVGIPAAGVYPMVVQDMDGQTRREPKEVGADQAADAPVLYRPLSSQDVGPDWM